MNTLKLLLGDIIPTSNKSDEVVEVANLPPTPITKYGAFLLAVGLRWTAKTDEAKRLADLFVKQIFSIINVAKLKSYGFEDNHLKIHSDPKALQLYSKELRTIIRKSIANDSDITREELSFLRFGVSFMENPYRPNYVNRARKYATKVSLAYTRNFDKVINEIGKITNDDLSLSENRVEELYDKLFDAYYELMGVEPKNNNYNIPVAVLKEKKLDIGTQDLVRKYRIIKRKISSSYDLDFASYVSKFDEPVYVHEAYKYMASLGYIDSKLLHSKNKIPLKVGVYSGKIKYYTEDNTPLAQGIPANANISFGSTYNKNTKTGAYIVYKTPEANGVTRVYTETHVNRSDTNKFSTAKNLSVNIDKIVNKWEHDLISKDPIKMMASTAAMLIYLTGARVGARQTSAASMTGKPTYGIISLRPGHVIIRGNTITLKYKGKKEVEQKHIIKVSNTQQKRILKNLETLKENKGRNDLLFSIEKEEGIKSLKLNYSIFKKYLTSTGYNAGPHKMRHIRGTNLVIEMLDKNKWVASRAATTLVKRQKEADKFIIEKIITPVTKFLGHKSGTGKDLWRTTIKSYIDPTPLLKWYNDKDLRKPNWLPSKTSSD